MQMGQPPQSQYGGYPAQYAPQADYGEQEAMPPQGMKGPVCRMPPEIRRDFVRKVYTIVGLQLAVTFVIGTWMHLNMSLADVKANIWMMQVASMGMLALLLGSSCCCPHILHTYPTNYAVLGVLTLCMSVVVGFSCALYTGTSVLFVMATTAGVVGCLTAYACFTKSDFTGMGPYLYAALSCLMMFGLVMSIWSWFGPLPAGMKLIYSCCGTVLFSFYIVYDTQLIVGGTHKKHEFEVDDYCFAALNLYLDIINLFLLLLELLGERSEG